MLNLVFAAGNILGVHLASARAGYVLQWDVVFSLHVASLDSHPRQPIRPLCTS